VKTYVLRRLLLMIPTFFGISLIVFVVLNLAPGRPGAQQNAELGADAQNEATQESYRIFREQFNLDKPTLFNTLFMLERSQVRQQLEIAAGAQQSTLAERIAAQQRLEDYGQYAVPHLISLLRAERHGSSKLRDSAVYFLRLNARRRLIDPFSKSPSAEVREQNRRIDAENTLLRSLSYASGAPEAEKRRIIERWLEWYDRNTQRFQFSLGQKVSIFFLETRFATYWSNLLRLDFGVSLVNREPVFRTLLSKLKYSITLSVGSLLLAYLIAIPLGIFSAVRRDTRAERVTTVALFMLYSLPSFFVATLLLIFFSYGSSWDALKIFPTGGFQSSNVEHLTTWQRIKDVAWHLVLPLFCLTYASLAALSRYMRTGLLEVIQSDYVRTARAKGLPERLVIGKHALRNALLPILTLLAGLLPAILGGSVVIEYIFGIPGMGLWVIEAIYQRDYNVIMCVQLASTVLVLLGILLTDLSYALVDPRIRFQ
jgi:peptide/nickel transport system permease protein